MATILIIEDDPNSIKILTRVLERAGHEVMFATEGLSGVKIIHEQKVDLILLDMGLPDLGGHTVAALIKRIPGSVPIVAVTASTDPAVERRARSYGCAGYITKPINTRTFIEQITPYLGGATEPGKTLIANSSLSGATEPGKTQDANSSLSGTTEPGKTQDANPILSGTTDPGRTQDANSSRSGAVEPGKTQDANPELTTQSPAG
ncbi:MAG: response regulator [Anaerolineae bacterium]|nr:response regulator [Anaerolineae bacterium]